MLLCPRRAGKTFVFASLLIVTCLLKPGASCVYITMTRGVAKRNIWYRLKSIIERLGIEGKWNGVELSFTFALGGSKITLAGADNDHEIDKFRGAPYDLVIIDEGKSFPPDTINELVREVLEPCLYDSMGTLVIGGTPGAVLAGAFYEVSSDKALMIMEKPDGERYSKSRPFADRDKPEWKDVVYRWSLHRWNTADNVKKPWIWEQSKAAHKANNESDSDPRWLREDCGRWVADGAAFVYKYGQAQDLCSWEPGKLFPITEDNPFGLDPEHEWHFVLGVDLGYDDDFDMEVAAWSETCDTFYHVWGYSSPGLTIADIARRIKAAEEKFGKFDTIVGDRAGLGKTIFASLADTYGVEIEAADKTDKRDYIELVNSDIISGKVKILKDSTLAQQMSLVQWDEKKRREDKAFANHACDAFLYLWRSVFHHQARTASRVATPGSLEWARLQEEAEFQRALERRRQRETMDSLDDGRPLDYEEGALWDA